VGPEPGVAESANIIDLIATAFEVMIVFCCIGSLAPQVRDRHLARSALTRLVIVALAVVLTLTTWAVASPTEEGETNGHDSSEEHGGRAGDPPVTRR
jgi:hypothetical protein